MEILSLRDTGVAAAAEKAAGVLRDGGIVLFPTDTLYGLAVNATDPEAVARLRSLKGREPKKPVSVILPDVETVATYAVLDREGEAIARRLLPGALTLVLPATPAMPASVTDDGAVGIRIPDDPFCLALARAFGKPYTATSANRSGHETPGTVAAVLAQFGPAAARIGLAIDAGTREGNRPSTVLAVREGTLQVLREGALSREALGL